MSETTGKLWIVATPLGNAGDLSPRAREVLCAADVILAEDTRRAGLLFQRLGIERSGELVSFFEHNEEKRLPRVLEGLESGDQVALISDAGTPLLSDPGFTLVRACRERNIAVSPVPGPSAPVTALSACGLPPLPYTFLGFLPRKPGQILALLESHGSTNATLVFFERKTRLAQTLELAFQALGDREVCVCRELTKEFEEFLSGRLSDLAAMNLDLKGEITVVIGPSDRTARTSPEDLADMVAEETGKGGKSKEIARRVVERASGWTAKEVYATMARR